MPAQGTAFAHPEPVPDKLGRYQILGVIANGGMGQVLLGFDPELERKVAIKAVRCSGFDTRLKDDLESRLFREARMAAGLNHEGIVRIYDLLRLGQAGYIVMEFVPGRSLQEIWSEATPCDPAFVRKVMRESAAALDHAHAHNIVHRDIKPGNIMIDEQTGVVRITDFGIAKLVDRDANTDPGVVLGTFEYMAPEQLNGGKIDGRADQFALAILAQRMLTGAPIYSADTMRRLCYQITNEPPPSAHSLNPALPRAVDTALMKALSKEASDRYPTCSQFVRDLDVAFETHVSPSGPELSDSPSSSPGRRLKLAALATLVLGILIAAIVVFTFRRKPSVIQPIPTNPTVSQAPVAQLEQSLTLPSGNMVLVEGGEAHVGPLLQAVNIPSFYIDVTEVTNSAYLAFCNATKRPVPANSEGAPPGYPVINVSFDDAQAFAQWVGKRLPTAFEWEKAARGPEGRIYPWGDEWKDGVANLPADSSPKGIGPANSFATGASIYGAMNMVGNVWEWTSTNAQADDTGFERLSRAFAHLRPQLTKSEPMYETRGGSYLYRTEPGDRPRLVYDYLAMPGRLSRVDLGFRCARNP